MNDGQTSQPYMLESMIPEPLRSLDGFSKMLFGDLQMALFEVKLSQRGEVECFTAKVIKLSR